MAHGVKQRGSPKLAVGRNLRHRRGSGVLALRLQVPVYVAEAVLEAAQVEWRGAERQG